MCIVLSGASDFRINLCGYASMAFGQMEPSWKTARFLLISQFLLGLPSQSTLKAIICHTMATPKTKLGNKIKGVKFCVNRLIFSASWLVLALPDVLLSLCVCWICLSFVYEGIQLYLNFISKHKIFLLLSATTHLVLSRIYFYFH